MNRHAISTRQLPTAIALAFFAAACGKKDAAAVDSTQAAVVGARTAIATRQSVRETIDGLGTIAARPDHIAQMSAPAVTRVTKVFATVGEQVSAGAPLIAFDRAPLDAQNAAAATALASAQRNVERSKRLVDAGIAPRKDLDQAESDLARANADAIAAEHLQARAILRAPLAGVVTRMAAVLGATVDPAQTLVEVTDASALDLVIPVPPAQAAHVRRGALVDMASQPGGDAEALGMATVADVGATIDSAARAVLVRAPITKPARQLRVGETVFARILVAAHENAVTVPVEALVPEGEGLKVFVVDAAHAAHATAVTVGVRDRDLAEITSGLSGGETVVTYGAYGITDSAKVLSPAESPAATTIPVSPTKP
jgi:membrane fusion protein (multidrug efflux system)